MSVCYTRSKLSEANLKGADLSGANLRDTTIDQWTQLDHKSQIFTVLITPN
ncbi:MAG: pentapeptide repeat-containing protein [Xenococcus sp. (in: cyanobacteria)]